METLKDVQTWTKSFHTSFWTTAGKSQRPCPNLSSPVPQVLNMCANLCLNSTTAKIIIHLRAVTCLADLKLPPPQTSLELANAQWVEPEIALSAEPTPFHPIIRWARIIRICRMASVMCKRWVSIGPRRTMMGKLARDTPPNRDSAVLQPKRPQMPNYLLRWPYSLTTLCSTMQLLEMRNLQASRTL